MSDSVLVEVQDRVATVTINRPDRLNALDSATNRKLAEVWTEIDRDDDIWVVVLTGSGEKAFCVGADLKDPQALPGAEPDGPRIGFGGGLTGIAGRLTELRKPLIAAVNGYALGGGFELAVSCDLIVAAEQAAFGIPEGRVGWVSESPVVHRAVRQLPYRVAMGMILTGRELTAAQALHFGLVNEVVAPDRLEAATKQWVDGILGCSPLAVTAMKEAAKIGLDLPLSAALSTRFDAIEDYQHTADRLEGIAAFREKREPRWTGR